MKGFVAEWARRAPTRPIRRRIVTGRARWLEGVPESIRRALDIEGEAVVPLRVELGCGPYPTPGYVHVDSDPAARHVEYRSDVGRLPFETGSVHEILAIHVLEHVHPARLHDTIREWHRALVPGGVLRVHVPSAEALFSAFLRADVNRKWACSAALLGMDTGPDVSAADEISPTRNLPDHKAVFDFELLSWLLRDCGFADVVDRTATESDRHSVGWANVVDSISLIVRATKPTSPA